MKIRFYFGWYGFSGVGMVARCPLEDGTLDAVMRKSARTLAYEGCEHTPICPIGPMSRFGYRIDGGDEIALDVSQCTLQPLGGYFEPTEKPMVYAFDSGCYQANEWFMTPVEIEEFDPKKLVLPFYRIELPKGGDEGSLNCSFACRDFLAIDQVTYDGVPLVDSCPAVGSLSDIEHWKTEGGRISRLHEVCDVWECEHFSPTGIWKSNVDLSKWGIPPPDEPKDEVVDDVPLLLSDDVDDASADLLFD